MVSYLRRTVNLRDVRRWLTVVKGLGTVILSGLASITFRKLPPRAIVELVRQAGLDGIEWGGDVHVPHGDLEAARAVRRLTADAGLKVASYGSYYRACGDDALPFRRVLDTGLALGAKVIRIWAGRRGSAQADAAYRAAVVEQVQKDAALAAEAGVALAFEYHRNTLTDDHLSARRLLEEVDRQNVKTYWQPERAFGPDQCLETLETVLPWLCNLHVFNWDADANRYPLAGASEPWKRYLQSAMRVSGDHYALLEFVKDDDPKQFLADAAVLRECVAWVHACGEGIGAG